MSTIGEKIKELREALGQTRDEFAKRFSVTYFTVRDWEQGRLEPATERLVRMAALAHPPLCWDFLSAAGISLKLVQRKLQEYAEYLDAEGASKQLRHLELELERLQAEKDKQDKSRLAKHGGRKGGK